jgi:hypothetical protein
MPAKKLDLVYLKTVDKKRPITALVILKADDLDHPANRPVASHPKTTKANSQ